MACKFLNTFIKCCYECKVREICPKVCSGFDYEGKDCTFYDDTIGALCVFETSIKKGEPLD